MKKTLITLLALSGLAMGDTWYNITTTGDTAGADFFANDGKNYTILKNGYGDNITVSETVKTELTTSGKANSLNFGTADGGSAAISVSISDSIHANVVNTTRATSLTFDFGQTGSLTAKGLFQISSTVSKITLSATLTEAELAKLDARENVTRTLITTDFIDNISIKDLATKLTLGSIAGSSATKGGVIYSLTMNGITSYYNISDVTVPTGVNNANRYVSVSNAKAIDLAANTSYIVIGGINSDTGAAMKTVSYMVTAVPEPTTATLSLLALAGLAARRRRR